MSKLSTLRKRKSECEKFLNQKRATIQPLEDEILGLRRTLERLEALEWIDNEKPHPKRRARIRNLRHKIAQKESAVRPLRRPVLQAEKRFMSAKNAYDGACCDWLCQIISDPAASTDRKKAAQALREAYLSDRIIRGGPTLAALEIEMQAVV